MIHSEIISVGQGVLAKTEARASASALRKCQGKLAFESTLIPRGSELGKAQNVSMANAKLVKY